jgi:hypothetical protein
MYSHFVVLKDLVHLPDIYMLIWTLYSEVHAKMSFSNKIAIINILSDTYIELLECGGARKKRRVLTDSKQKAPID